MKTILILGPRRSGTTLMNQILCNAPGTNPHVGEAQILTRLCTVYRWSKENHERLVKWYFESPDACRDFFRRTVKDFVDAAKKNFGNIETLVLKNPEFSNVKPELDELLPNAYKIVCLRDPRDQVASEMDVGKRQQEKAMDGYAAKAYKNRNINLLAEKYLKYYNSVTRGNDHRTVYIRYEDLVFDLPGTLRLIEKFAKINLESYDPDKKWQRFEHENHIKKMPAYVRQYGSPLDKSRVGRYKDMLTVEEAQFIVRKCEVVMTRHYRQ